MPIQLYKLKNTKEISLLTLETLGAHSNGREIGEITTRSTGLKI
jgi:hypothetical protein